jgi:acetyl-CoA acetyltransferase
MVTFSLQINAFKRAQDCLLPMGITSENIAHWYGVTRQDQDQTVVSHLAMDNFNFIVSSLH